MTKLPAKAQTYVDGINADLERTKCLVGEHAKDENCFILMQTGSRYLPDILRAYEAIPEESRASMAMKDDGKSADQILVAQLEKLAWATRKAAEAIIRDKGQELVVNERFIGDKFPDQVETKSYEIIKQKQQFAVQVARPLTLPTQEETLTPEQQARNNRKDTIVFGSLITVPTIAIFGWCFLVSGPSNDVQKIKAESAIMANFDYNVGYKDGEVIEVNPQMVIPGIDQNQLEDAEKPGQYKIKKNGNNIIIIDLQEHLNRNLNGLPKDGGGKCAGDCWHLEYKDGKTYGRT